MKNLIKDIQYNWKECWQSNVFKLQFFVSIVVFFLAAKYCKYYIGIFSHRSGTLLNDPILNLFHSRDFSLPIFLIFHFIIIVGFAFLIKNPKQLVIGLKGYALLMIFRTITIYLIPLEAPTDMIFLNDPLAAIYMHKNGVVVNDLFFSGHVSTGTFFFLITQNKTLKKIILCLTITTATLILWQKVHYTVDVVFAPFFAFISLKMMAFVFDKIQQTEQNQQSIFSNN